MDRLGGTAPAALPALPAVLLLLPAATRAAVALYTGAHSRLHGPCRRRPLHGELAHPRRPLRRLAVEAALLREPALPLRATLATSGRSSALAAVHLAARRRRGTARAALARRVVRLDNLLEVGHVLGNLEVLRHLAELEQKVALVETLARLVRRAPRAVRVRQVGRRPRQRLGQAQPAGRGALLVRGEARRRRSAHVGVRHVRRRGSVHRSGRLGRRRHRARGRRSLRRRHRLFRRHDGRGRRGNGRRRRLARRRRRGTLRLGGRLERAGHRRRWRLLWLVLRRLRLRLGLRRRLRRSVRRRARLGLRGLGGRRRGRSGDGGASARRSGRARRGFDLRRRRLRLGAARRSLNLHRRRAARRRRHDDGRANGLRRLGRGALLGSHGCSRASGGGG
eukprot:Opistho-1_new@9388